MATADPKMFDEMKMASAHTPGPWSCGSHRIEGPETVVLDTVHAVRVADARLIAAAPDLLAALKHCVIERSEWLEEARTAIAKATGGR